MKRVLVIRGGAIGDFVLTLPAIKLLRNAFPSAHLEIIGQKHIAVLAEKRFYADAVRSIDSASFARFFAEGADLPSELCEYFASFDLIVSYLYDPDRIFERNVGRCSRGVFLAAPAKLDARALPRSNWRAHSKRWGLKFATQWRGFIQAMLIAPLSRISARMVRASRFIPAAVVKQRTGRSRTGPSSGNRF